jgi:hypothetical protein
MNLIRIQNIGYFIDVFETSEISPYQRIVELQKQLNDKGLPLITDCAVFLYKSTIEREGNTIFVYEFVNTDNKEIDLNTIMGMNASIKE